MAVHSAPNLCSSPLPSLPSFATLVAWCVHPCTIQPIPIQEAQRLDEGRHPPRALALAALDVAGREEAVTSASILQTLRGDVQKRCAGGAIGASPRGQEEDAGSSGAAGGSGGGGGGGGRRVLLDRGSEESSKSFGSVAAHCLGE